MSLTFQALADILPPGSIEFVGNNQLKFNFSQLTGETLTFNSSCVEPIVKLMQKLADLTTAVNSVRASESPSKPPIMFASKDLIGTPDAPEFEFTIRVAVDTSQFANNLIDPTND
jgi:hypothetical protein